VLLVEDSEVYRQSLEFLLSRAGGVEVAGAVGDGRTAVAAVLREAPDVVVLDYRLPDVDGAEVAAELRRRAPDVAVVFLSASAGREEYDAAALAGAPLVRKDAGVDALVAAVLAAGRRGG
jgi:two-component system nitrate/nitrite response regulator NarL